MQQVSSPCSKGLKCNIRNYILPLAGTRHNAPKFIGQYPIIVVNVGRQSEDVVAGETAHIRNKAVSRCKQSNASSRRITNQIELADPCSKRDEVMSGGGIPTPNVDLVIQVVGASGGAIADDGVSCQAADQVSACFVPRRVTKPPLEDTDPSVVDIVTLPANVLASSWLVVTRPLKATVPVSTPLTLISEFPLNFVRPFIVTPKLLSSVMLRIVPPPIVGSIVMVLIATICAAPALLVNVALTVSNPENVSASQSRAAIAVDVRLKISVVAAGPFAVRTLSITKYVCSKGRTTRDVVEHHGAAQFPKQLDGVDLRVAQKRPIDSARKTSIGTNDLEIGVLQGDRCFHLCVVQNQRVSSVAAIELGEGGQLSGRGHR